MKKINFTKLTVKNFLSIGNEPVVINFKQGLNVIQGINRDEDDIHNGVGKSSILSAFYFAIFGNTMRELPKQFIINRKIGKFLFAVYLHTVFGRFDTDGMVGVFRMRVTQYGG